MGITIKAPSTVAVGSPVEFYDGTIDYVDADSLLELPDGQPLQGFLEAGWTITAYQIDTPAEDLTAIDSTASLTSYNSTIMSSVVTALNQVIAAMQALNAAE
ncbi:MAG: hypothetical protein ABFD81_03635 [Syntrophaceae bacterium]